MNRETSTDSGYLPTLDGWRAIAITMVLITHGPRFSGALARLEPIQFQCYLGVDVFFAISGILICSRLLHGERLLGTIDLKSFYLRRVFRIFPALYVYLGVLALLALAQVIPIDWPAWASALVFLRNYFTAFVRETYIARFTYHFWSLGIEEHFYLLLPPLLAFFPRRRKLVLASLVVLCLVWTITYLGTTPPLDRQLHWERRTDLRLNSLLFPALLALIIQDRRARTWIARLTKPALLGGIVLVLLCAQYARRNLVPHSLPVRANATRSNNPVALIALPPAPPGARETALESAGYSEKDGQSHLIANFAVPFVFPFLILATMLHPASLPSRLLEWTPLRALGRVSYSLYLWQQLFWISTPYRHWPIHHAQRPFVGAFLVIVFTLASYFLVEKPLIRLGRRITEERLVPVLDDRSLEQDRVSALRLPAA